MLAAMDSTAATRILQHQDGSESLLLRCARLSVTRGPDAGQELGIETPRISVGSAPDCDLVLSDPAVSRRHFELIATEGGYLLRDLGSTNGTRAGGVRLQRALLDEPTLLTLGSTTLRLEPRDELLELPLSARGRFGQLLGQSPAMRRVFALLESAAKSDSTVLIEGESGTGKELAARALHDTSPRAAGPFVVVDCGAIPEQLIESELFGHERGAFSGADKKRNGAFSQAHGGTVFLDEIGELPLALQPRLLRFLESKQVKRVGGDRHQRVDVRVVAATNRSLAARARSGDFREDVYYRLAVVRVELPPLRDRPEDIALLAYHFAASFVADPAQLIDDKLSALLMAHSWPGNARELRNIIETVAALPDRADELLHARTQAADVPAHAEIGELVELPFHEARQRWQARFERSYLHQQLERADGVVSRAAERAALPRPTLHTMLKRHGLR
jgi:DNA-binding NtrC family response regulator